MNTRIVRTPATNQTDRRARAYDASMALADLSNHLDPSTTVSLQVSAQWTISALLHFATVEDAAQLAARLGLTEHTERPAGGQILHRWSGRFAGHSCQVDCFAKAVACDTCGAGR